MPAVAGAAGSILVNLQAFPLMAWYTIDGILLVAAGAVLLDCGLERDRRLLVRFGCLCLGAAVVAAQVVAGGYTCRVRVIGDGPERASLEALARGLGIEGRVHFTGALLGSELLAILDDVTAVVAPSMFEEPAGLAVIEHITRGGLVIFGRCRGSR